MTEHPTPAHERISRTLEGCFTERLSAERREYRLELAIQGLTVPALVEFLAAEGIRFTTKSPRRSEVLVAMGEVLGIDGTHLK